VLPFVGDGIFNASSVSTLTAFFFLFSMAFVSVGFVLHTVFDKVRKTPSWPRSWANFILL
jgi:hypothetical protein